MWTIFSLNMPSMPERKICWSDSKLLNQRQAIFRFNDTANTEIYTLSLHDTLPIYKHIKFDKITVWDGGTGTDKGSTTANFMKDLIKSLPAMHDLAGQAGIELPQILGKVDNGAVEEVKATVSETKEEE